jgi:DNA-binding NarL/FixJ family response regulator
MTPWTVVVADAVSMSRLGVTSILERDPRFRAVECDDADELVTAVTTLHPSAALVDTALPPRGGLQAVAHVASVSTCRTILWGATASAQGVLAALAAGASGTLTKEVSAPGLRRALAAACGGEAVLARRGATWVVDAVRRAALDPPQRQSLYRLSTRERQVLRLVTIGDQNRDIGDALGISEFTVKRHVQNILLKLDCSSREQAAAAYLAGLAPQAASTGYRDAPANRDMDGAL